MHICVCVCTCEKARGERDVTRGWMCHHYPIEGFYDVGIIVGVKR